MLALLFAISLVLASFAVHVIVWRVRLPRRQTRALLLVFSLVPITVILAIVSGFAPGRFYSPVAAEIPAIALFYMGATCTYLITYYGIEDTSPSLTIIRAVQRSGTHGCSREELEVLLSESQPVESRLAALKSAGYLTPSGTGFLLAPRGMRAARAARFFAKLFNIHESA
jgi:hypothetical protein